MPNKCCVPDCKSNYGSQVKTEGWITLFSFPKNQFLKDNWLRAIPGKLKSSNYVCIKHFDENYIRKYGVAGHENTKYKYPKLASDAIPTIFDQCSLGKMKKSKRKKRKITETQTLCTTDSTDFVTNFETILLCTADDTDIVTNFESLKNEIHKIDLHRFKTIISDNEICLCTFEQNAYIDKKLNIETSIIISENLDINIFYKNNQQNNTEIITDNKKLMLFSQLNELIHKYSNINCLNDDEKHENMFNSNVTSALANLKSAKNNCSDIDKSDTINTIIEQLSVLINGKINGTTIKKEKTSKRKPNTYKKYGK